MRFRCRLEPGELKQEEDVNVDEVRSHARRKSGTFCIMMCIGMALSIPASHAESIWPPLDTPPVPLRRGPCRPRNQSIAQWVVGGCFGRAAGRQDGKTQNNTSGTPDGSGDRKAFPAHRKRLGPFRISAERLAPLKDRTGARIDWPREFDAKGPNLKPLLHVTYAALVRTYWHVDHGRPEAAFVNLEMLLSSGQLMESAEGGLINVMLGVAVSQEVLEHTAHLLPYLRDEDSEGVEGPLMRDTQRPGRVGHALAYDARMFEEHYAKGAR